MPIHYCYQCTTRVSVRVLRCGYLDYSEAFRKKFCTYMNDTSASCVLPSHAERDVVRTGNAFLCGSVANESARRVVALNMLHVDIITDTLTALAKTVKEATDNKILILAFYGYIWTASWPEFGGYGTNLVSYGHLSARALLDSPHIDGLVAPYIYDVRTRSQTSPLFPQVPYSSVAHKNKLMIVEDDLRTGILGDGPKSATKLVRAQRGYQWCFDLSCAQNMMRRNILSQTMLQVGSYRFDLMGAGWFGMNDTAHHRADTAALWKTIGHATHSIAAVDPLNGPLPVPEIAVFIDERAALTQPIDGHSWGAWAIDGVLAQIGQLGAPRRHFYTDDLPTIDRSTIKFAIFPNAFAPSQAVRDALSAWQNNGSMNTTFLFTGPAGLVQTDARDASKECTVKGSAISEFVGIPGMRLDVSANYTKTVINGELTPEEEAAFPGISELKNTTYGDTARVYSPVALGKTGTDDTSTNLGFIGNQAGEASLVASKLRGGGWSIVSAARHIPAALYLVFAKAAGVHIYGNGTDTDVVASGNGLYVHAIGPTEATTRNGTRTVHLPSAMLVMDEDGHKVCSTACTSFDVALEAGSSKLFIIT